VSGDSQSGATGGAATEEGARLAGLERVRARLHARLDRPVPLTELAQLAGLSKFHLVRAFRRWTGLPPHQYHLKLRLDRGRELLAEGVQVSAIAATLGFSDQAHFATHFRRRFGLAPRAWLRALADGNNSQEDPGPRP
jgi:AraC-like DNA-binding protein